MKEAWPLVTVAAFLGLVLNAAFSLAVALPVWALAVVVAWLHRAPVREVPSDPLAVVSPVDGKLRKVIEVSDPVLSRRSIKMKFRKHWYNLYQLRSPIEGKVQDIKILCKDINRSLFVPYAIWIRTDEQDDLVLVAEAARFMRRPQIYIQAGERVGQGQHFGYIPFGRHFDVYLPHDARVMIETSQRVNGASTTIARFTHR